MNDRSKIKNLKDRINKLDNSSDLKKNKIENKSGISFGFRIGIEIVSALVIGTTIGIIVDKYLNSKPFGLIIFFILGAMAGFLNIYRVIRRIEKR